MSPDRPIRESRARLPAVRAFVTGATGFIGGRLARRLLARGDDVVALVRSPDRAAWLGQAGARLEAGDLGGVRSEAMAGSDAVFHVAAMYEVGIPRSKRPAMFEANVRGTERVIDAAVGAGVPRIVYVSTIGAFGNTHGKVLDESHRHPRDSFGTYYEETKALAHEVARERAARGAPMVIVCPGGVYGPGDTSDLGGLIDRVRRGRLPGRMYPETGFNWAYIDDVVDGILLACERGRVGETYALGGEIGTIGDMIDAVAGASGRKAPGWRWPSPLVKAGIPFGRVIGPVLGLGPNLRELIRGAEDATYWISDAKARGELGYRPRPLAAGVRDMLAERAT